MDPSAYIEIAKVENQHWWFLARRQIIVGVLRGLGLPQDADILELGAGTGGNLNMLAGFGNVYGAEMDGFAREVATRQTSGNFPIEYGRCPDAIPFEETKFDLICMFDVLEHVREDVETLDALRGRLTHNGQLLITVPAYQWMWSGHDEFLHHMRRYTKSELRAKLTGAGYKINKLTYFNTLLFPLAALVRLADRFSQKTVTSVNDLPHPAVNNLLRHIFAAEAPVVRFGNMPFGVSLLAVAEYA